MTPRALGCTRCGSCCDPVLLTPNAADVLAKWADIDGIPDPKDDEKWVLWLAVGWIDEQRDSAIHHYHSDSGNRYAGEFAAEHWRLRGEPDEDGWVRYDCDQFDPATRLCAAGDARPPVCKGYPWYGDGPTAERAESLHGHCSYLLDVAPEARPEGSRPLIPVEVLTR